MSQIKMLLTTGRHVAVFVKARKAMDRWYDVSELLYAYFSPNRTNFFLWCDCEIKSALIDLIKSVFWLEWGWNAHANTNYASAKVGQKGDPFSWSWRGGGGGVVVVAWSQSWSKGAVQFPIDFVRFEAHLTKKTMLRSPEVSILSRLSECYY